MDHARVGGDGHAHQRVAVELGVLVAVAAAGGLQAVHGTEPRADAARLVEREARHLMHVRAADSHRTHQGGEVAACEAQVIRRIGRRRPGKEHGAPHRERRDEIDRVVEAALARSGAARLDEKSPQKSVERQREDAAPAVGERAVVGQHAPGAQVRARRLERVGLRRIEQRAGPRVCRPTPPPT